MLKLLTRAQGLHDFWSILVLSSITSIIRIVVNLYYVSIQIGDHD